MRLNALSAVLLVAVLAATGCGGDSGSADDTNGDSLGPPTVVRLTYDDGSGNRQSARLTCTDAKTDATGFLSEQARGACRHIDSAGKSLFALPPEDQACTQIYGGPQTLKITGRVDFDSVDRTFSRTNGCEIADWEMLGALLPPDAPKGTG